MGPVGADESPPSSAQRPLENLALPAYAIEVPATPYWEFAPPWLHISVPKPLEPGVGGCPLSPTAA